MVPACDVSTRALQQCDAQTGNWTCERAMRTELCGLTAHALANMACDGAIAPNVLGHVFKT